MTDGASLRWGVVGTGDVSRSIASDLRLLDPAGLAATCSRSVGRARDLANEFGFQHAHGSIEEFLADDAVDIVYIGTPHSTHADLAIRALQAGKHVLIEKPLGISEAEVQRVADVARSAGRFVMEGMWMKFHAYYRAMLDDVRAGSIGQVTSIRGYFGLPFGPRDSPRWSPELASSTLLDQGIYPVTLAFDVFGEPTSVRASADVRHDGIDLADEATLGFGGGRYAHIGASMVGYLEPSASLSGTAGWMTVPAPFWAADRYTRHSGDIGEALMSPTTVAFEREGHGYVPMLRAVAEAIAEGRLEHPIHPLSSSVAVARILDSIRAAAAAPSTTTETHS